jgi:hypothetical protein
MTTSKIVLPDIEVVSEQVHKAWIESKLAMNVTSRLSETGEELMVPYTKLSEAAKDLDRSTVMAVYTAIENLGVTDSVSATAILTLDRKLSALCDHLGVKSISNQAESKLREVVVEILNVAKDIPDGLYSKAQYLARM